MEPRITFQEGITQLEGLDIVLVVDLSSSMQEVMGGWEEHRELYDARARGTAGGEQMPMPETRMEAVQNALFSFVNIRTSDRLALVTFSENSYVVSPLTTDRGYLEKYILMIDPAILIGEGMTAIGEGINTAIQLFRREEDPETKNKVVVVFSDGEHNYGRDPVDALSEARFYGYRVYLIGVELGEEITRKEKVQELIQAIRDSGGQYFDARNQEQLELAYTTIDEVEKGCSCSGLWRPTFPTIRFFSSHPWPCFSWVLPSTRFPISSKSVNFESTEAVRSKALCGQISSIDVLAESPSCKVAFSSGDDLLRADSGINLPAMMEPMRTGMGKS